MDRIPVQSSLVKSVGYNPLLKRMEFELTNGDIGAFVNVGEEAANEFNEAPSVGKGFWGLRRAGYTFEKGEK